MLNTNTMSVVEQLTSPPPPNPVDDPSQNFHHSTYRPRHALAETIKDTLTVDENGRAHSPKGELLTDHEV